MACFSKICLRHRKFGKITFFLRFGRPQKIDLVYLKKGRENHRSAPDDDPFQAATGEDEERIYLRYSSILFNAACKVFDIWGWEKSIGMLNVSPCLSIIVNALTKSVLTELCG